MKQLLILLFFCSAQFCRAEPRSLLEAPDKPSEKAFLTSMEEVNKQLINEKISAVLSKILGAVLAVSLYYAYRTAKSGVYATTNFFFPERVGV